MLTYEWRPGIVVTANNPGAVVADDNALLVSPPTAQPTHHPNPFAVLAYDDDDDGPHGLADDGLVVPPGNFENQGAEAATNDNLEFQPAAAVTIQGARDADTQVINGQDVF